jgi:succinylarginine dihydrolase
MNLSRIVLTVCTIIFVNSVEAQSWKKIKLPTKTTTSTGGLGGLLGGSSSGSGSMTNELAANGLKQALSVGTDLATNNLGQIDGFLANAAVKILFPPEARKIESTLRSLGMGSVCDQVITSVNRAAEAAVVEAKPIFVEAIKQMTITDAINILTGNKDAATQYLQRTSGQALMAKFEPIIQSNLQKTNATRYWSDAVNAYNNVRFGQKLNPNLSQYVTQKASDGIFLMVAAEEAKIRENPSQRVGSILQDVFGWADKNRK